jgi:hypothetical protein
MVTPAARGRSPGVVLAGAQPEGEHQKCDAESQGVGAEPPGQDHRADHRRGREDNRDDAGEGEPPAAVLPAQPDGGAEHEPAGDERLGGQQQHEGDHRQAGHEKRDHADPTSRLAGATPAG